MEGVKSSMEQIKNNTDVVGKIIAVSDLNVTVLAVNETVKNRDILSVTMDGQERLFEVSDVNGSLISCIPLTSVIGLKKGLTVVKKSESLDILYNDNILGRVFNSYGEPIDNQPEGHLRRGSLDRYQGAGLLRTHAEGLQDGTSRWCRCW